MKLGKTNFALLAALYDTKGAGLYQDIYFPAVSYAFTQMHSKQRSDEVYYDASNVQLIIQSLFGVTIPIPVLKQSLVAIQNSNQSLDVNFTVYENGAKILVRKRADISVENAADVKLIGVESAFVTIEIGFKDYLKSFGIESDTTFLSLVNDNAVDIYKYYETGGADTLVNERYYHIFKYLESLKQNDIKLYQAATNIFWGSVVAGYLGHDRELSINKTDSVEYYFDTSLVLALLDLDSEENVSYAHELLNIIKTTSSRVIVHEMTLQEVENVLQAVERTGRPYSTSSIEKAYDRKSLTPTGLMQIRTSMRATLTDKLEVNIRPVQFTPTNKNEIITKYRNKPIVKDLSTLRCKQNSEWHNDLAEIHDIFIVDHIKQRRGSISSIEKNNCSFLSFNSELMIFIQGKYPEARFPLIVHPSRIITDLWIHGVKFTKINEIALTEAVSRCMVLNEKDVRRKMRSVVSHFDDSYSAEEYANLELALINRAADVINEVDTIDNNSGIAA